jgi:hypothetical protein
VYCSVVGALPTRVAALPSRFSNGVVKMQKNEKAPIAPVAPVAPVADVSALSEQIASLANVVATLAQASLAPRVSRSRRTVSAVALSPVEAFCAQAGFRSGSARNKLFCELFARGSGDYPLADFPGVNTGDANVVSRRLARKGLPFSLAIDGEERGAARVIFADLREKSE